MSQYARYGVFDLCRGQDILFLMTINHHRFNSLYQRLYKTVYSFLYPRINNKEDIDDVAQEVFLTAYRTFEDSYYEDDTAKKYLFIIARNRLVDYYRKNNKKPPNLSLDDGWDDDSEMESLQPVDDGPLPEELFEQSEHRHQVTKLLNTLNQKDRELLVLRFIQDMSYADISEVLKVDEGTIRQRVSRALSKIRNNNHEQ